MNNYLIILAALLFSGLFSGTEIAFLTANKLKVALDKNKGTLPFRVISGWMENPSAFLATLMLGNTISLVVYGLAMEPFLYEFITKQLNISTLNVFTMLIIQTIVATLIVLVVSEFLPKAIFRQKPNTALSFVFYPIYFIYILLYPLVFFLDKFAKFLYSSVLKIKIPEMPLTYSSIDLNHFIREFTRTSNNKELQQEVMMLQNVLDFKETRLRECMVPRTELIAADLHEQIPVIIHKFVETGHSKILIYNQNIDNIIGYVHSFDIFKKPAQVIEILKPIELFPETMTADKALKSLTQNKKSVAVIIDEFGGTAGMVTVEDLIEEIFGEINDEFDPSNQTDNRINEREFIFSGRAEIDHLNQKYAINLPESPEYETIAGLIINRHESIPKTGEQIHIGRFCFYIQQSNGKRIEKVKMTIKP